jgi:transposase
MFGFGPATRIYVATGATDMRKGFNGLYGLVRDHLGCDPESGHVFLFSNARQSIRHPARRRRRRTALSSCKCESTNLAFSTT